MAAVSCTRFNKSSGICTVLPKMRMPVFIMNKQEKTTLLNLTIVYNDYGKEELRIRSISNHPDAATITFVTSDGKTRELDLHTVQQCVLGRIVD